MQLEIRNRKNFLISASAFVVLIFGFQNCGQNMSAPPKSSTTNSQSSGATSLSPCLAAGCPQAFDYIQVEISNANPISFLASGANVLESNVDVSGYCNTGGFPGSHIYYSVQDLAGTTVIPVTSAPSTCSSIGKFHFPINLAGLSGSKNYQVNVILRAVDSTGLEFDSSLGLNKKQVGLSPRTGI